MLFLFLDYLPSPSLRRLLAAAIALSEDADAAMTAVHGLSFFCYSVVEDAATTVYLATTAADVDAAATNPYVEDTFLNIPDIY